MREPLSQAVTANTVQAGIGAAWRRSINLLKVLPLFAALCVPSPTVSADTQAVEGSTAVYAIESASARSGLLLDVVKAGQRLLAVGDRGHILYSDDQGRNWLQARVPTQQLLTAVYFIDDQYGWAVGHDALILASRDGGLTWERQYDSLEQEAPLLDIWFKDRNIGFAVGAYGMLLKTEDGGRDWQRIDEALDNEDGYHLNAISAVTDSGIFIVGEMGMMFRSSDDGASWQALEGPYQGSLFVIIAGQQPGHVLVYGLRGHIFRSSDFGDSWLETRVSTDSGALQFGLAGGAVLEQGDLLIVGHGGTVLRSQDDGASFSVSNRADRTSLAAVVGVADGALVLVGQNGVHRTDADGNDAHD